jgi:hypothetical protein
MSERWARSGRRLALGATVAALVAVLGCNSTGFNTNPLAGVGFTSGARGAMDGFVFVPSRHAGVKQTASGNTIPNATIQIYQLDGSSPVQLVPPPTIQADATGYYTVSNLPLDVPLEVVAIDPFELPGEIHRTVKAVISFTSKNDNKTRDLNDASTVVAAMMQSMGLTTPLSDQQISTLESAADAYLAANPNLDVTGSATDLAGAATQVAKTSFGSLDIVVYSNPVVAATVTYNGETFALTTALPGDTTAGGNLLTLSNLPEGQVDIAITASGFQEDDFTATVTANQTTVTQQTLLLVGQAGVPQPPVIVDEQASPQFLPFNGGQMTIMADATSPEGDALTVTATLTPSDDTATLGPLTLTNTSGAVYSGTIAVPGNPSIVARTYTVVISVVDPAVNPNSPVQDVLTFQVAGVDSPPATPTTTGTSRRR